MSPAEKSTHLIGLEIIVGLQPVFGIRGFPMGLAFFPINLIIFLYGFRTGRHRSFWVTWAMFSVAGLVAFGMTSPLDVLRILW
jgi:hypothetical protein